MTPLICQCKVPIGNHVGKLAGVCSRCLRTMDGDAMARFVHAASRGIKGKHGSSKHRVQRVEAFRAKQKQKALKRKRKSR